MFNNIKWNGVWMYDRDIKKNDFGQILSTMPYFCLVDENGEKCNIMLNTEKLILKQKGFYNLEDSEVKAIAVKPGEELIIYTHGGISYHLRDETRLGISKVGVDQYRVEIYEKKYENGQENEILEYLSGNQLKEKLKAFEPYLEVFPFSLPLGKCFEIDENE